MTPSIGSTEPIAGERQSLHPQYTLDVGIAQVIGSQPLTDNGALRVRSVPATVTDCRALIDAAGVAQQISTASANTIGIQLTGTFTATLVFEATVDLITWVACAATPSDGTAAAASATAAGLWTIGCAGLRAVRVRCSAYTSGSANCFLLATSAQR